MKGGRTLAIQSKIRNVTVHYPIKENQAEFDRRAARAVAKVLCKKYPPEVIEEIIKRLELSKEVCNGSSNRQI